ncbi:MAG: hypothetical protein LBQ86_07665 [Holophagales bacterium]|nr:hypothetical protein [Holophagales bacterium]
MPKVFLRCIATLLLAAVSAYYGHLLGEGMAEHVHADAHQISLADHCGGDGDADGHRHEHGMSCDQWLCSGFSGVILGSEAGIPVSANIKDGPFVGARNNNLHSRTTEPLENPPRV